MHKKWLLVACLAACRSSLAIASATATGEPHSTRPAAAETSVLKASPTKPGRKGLVIPKAKIFQTQKDLYTTSKEPLILLILHVPKVSGAVYVEIYNRTLDEISLFQFSLSALGHDGELEFEDLPPGWSAVKEVKLSSLRELAIRNARAFNKNADEMAPRLVIHQIRWSGPPMQVGKQPH